MLWKWDWILCLLFFTKVYSVKISLDQFVSPFSETISQNVVGNMSLSLSGKKGRSSGIQSRYIKRIHEKFNSQVSPILKSHVTKFIRRASKSIQAAKKASLLAMLDLQKKLIQYAFEEYDVDESLIQKRDLLKSIILLEHIIVQIYKWKNDHPEAIQELVKLEKSLFKFVQPGEDGTFETSELVLKLKKLHHAGIAKFWIYPVVFGAGSISMVLISEMFQWLIAQDDFY